MRVDWNDFLIACGLVMLFIGLWMISQALALSVVGGLLALAGLVGAWAKGTVKRE